jgi:hypothetical protein
VDGDWWTDAGVYAPVITEGVGAYVPPRPWINHDDDPPYGSDWASVFARVNKQAYHLQLDDIVGGGFTLSGVNHPNAVYGSLYLSPTDGSGSTVLILLSPMSYTGTGGNLNYTFDLTTDADVRAWNGVTWSVYSDATSGTFAHAIEWINTNGFGSNYAAFFGPQIGLSNTSGTTFTVTQIEVNTVPEPTTIIIWSLLGRSSSGRCWAWLWLDTARGGSGLRELLNKAEKQAEGHPLRADFLFVASVFTNCGVQYSNCCSGRDSSNKFVRPSAAGEMDAELRG